MTEPTVIIVEGAAEETAVEPPVVVVEAPAPTPAPEPPVIVVEAPEPSPVETEAAGLLAQANARISELEAQIPAPVIEVEPEPEPVQDEPPSTKHFLHKSLGELFGRK